MRERGEEREGGVLGYTRGTNIKGGLEFHFCQPFIKLLSESFKVGMKPPLSTVLFEKF